MIVDSDLTRDATGALATDATLNTFARLCLGTRARAKEGDRLQDDTVRGGWWGDAFLDKPGDSFGSRFWTLVGLHMGEALERAPAIALEALQPMIDAGLASRIEVQCEAVTNELLGVRIGVVQPGDTLVRWLDVWNQMV